MNFQYTPKVEKIVEDWYKYTDTNHGTKAGDQQDNPFTVEFIEDDTTDLQRFVNNWINEIGKLNDKEYQETVARTYAFVEDNLNDDMGSDAAYSNGLALLYKQCLDDLVLYQQVTYEIKSSDNKDT